MALFPEKAKLTVREEHYIVAELQRRLAYAFHAATLMEWDCRVPGGCSLKRPDLLVVFPGRYLQFEIDEDGHDDAECCEEDARLAIIAADVGLPGFVLRLNPDAPSHECFRRRQLCNGEMALDAVEENFLRLMDRAEGSARRFLEGPAPEGLRRVFLDARPHMGALLDERVW